MIKRLKLKQQLYFLLLFTLIMFCMYSILYYVGFSTINYRRAEKTAEQMISQVAQNVQEMCSSIEVSARGLSYNTYVRELLVSNDRVKNIELYDYVGEIVKAAKASNNMIYSINWVSDDFRRISDPTRDENGIVTRLHELYNFTSDDFRKPVYSPVIKGNNGSFYYYGYVFPVFSSDLSKIGCGVFVLNVWELEKLVKINNITENSLFIILNHENNVVVSNRDLETGDDYQDIFWGEEEQSGIVRTVMNYNGVQSIAQCMSIEENGWKVVSIIPMAELSSDMNDVVKINIFLAMVSVVLLVIFGHIMIKNITQPINKIVTFLQRTETNTLKSRIEIPSNNEIAIIASNINSMLDRVEHMTKKIVENQTLLYESKLAEQNAELLALQSQINPHFLYNTLNCLSNIGLAYDIPEIADISVAMSNIYRYSIKGDKIVTLNDEIQCIREYMTIMDIRFSGKFETEYRFEESMLQLYTLRMILQPIVENAVYHGLERRSGKGKLLIEGKISEDNQLILVVQDDGKAMSQEQVEQLRKMIQDYERVGLYNAEKSSIGLSNINKRIKIQFGSEYGLHIESEETVGTKVTLVLPVLHERYPAKRDNQT